MVRIDGTPIGHGHRPYVIAEAGVNFRGDVELAKVFIDAAAEAGADAIKFQTHLPGDEMVQSAMVELGFGDLFERMKTYELTPKDHATLKSACEENEITFLSTPFSVEAVKLLADIDVTAFKIGSGEFTNRHLVRTAGEHNRPLVLSTGMSSWEEIEETVPFVRKHVEEFALLYCLSAYPTEPDEFQLGVIDRLKEAFNVPVGISDHSTGIEVASIAMSRGADIVEKHFTIDRRLPGGDQDVSIEPEELKRLVEMAQLVYETDGDEKDVLADEANLKRWAQHSVVTRESLESGDRLSESNTTTKRPGLGIPASEYPDVMGRTVGRSVEADTVLTYEDLQS